MTERHDQTLAAVLEDGKRLEAATAFAGECGAALGAAVATARGALKTFQQSYQRHIGRWSPEPTITEKRLLEGIAASVASGGGLALLEYRGLASVASRSNPWGIGEKVAALLVQLATAAESGAQPLNPSQITDAQREHARVTRGAATRGPLPEK